MKKLEDGEVQVERLDDIPVIFGLLQKIGIQANIDQVIETHGNVLHDTLPVNPVIYCTVRFMARD